MLNGVLQHIPHKKIGNIIRKLMELGKKVYITEMYNSDFTVESFYLLKYNYLELFDKFGFKVIQKGLLGKQNWFLFCKKFYVKV